MGAIRDRAKPCMDHLGNNYTSKSEMASAYNLTLGVYNSRIRNGWTQEKALTIPIGQGYKSRLGVKVVVDGIEYNNRREYARASGLNFSAVASRAFRTGSVVLRKVDRVCDHLGNSFDTVQEMCDYHKQSYRLYHSRLHQGKSLECCLNPLPLKGYVDYLGNYHRTRSDCAKLYSMPHHIVSGRLKSGWTDREAMITPLTYGTSKPIVNDITLNSQVCIHEFSHIAEGTNDRVFRVTIVSTNEIKYMNEYQIKSYPEGWY